LWNIIILEEKNMTKMYIPELLAPAGSIDALKAAVNAGADAVYISGKKFGARKFATNFSESEIEEGVKYAKLRGVKVYITVNTLIHDSQLLSIAEYLIWLYKIGIDAIIIQDLGVAYLSKSIVPEIVMHASTQMTIYNNPGIEWASKFGFKRVILSRELAISEVKEIIKESEKTEIEIFGHGALCYSYSGQCLLSSFIGGRSGNKGMCAQPCRKKYSLISGEIDNFGRPSKFLPIDICDKYLLSTKDLAVYENLEIVASSKIDSLKIEGRMRSAEYVGIVVKIYRKALNSLSKGNWKPNLEDISKLKLAFNRGFTGGYLTESNNSVMNRKAPGNRGLYIGHVINFNEKTKSVSIKLENRYRIEKGDGIAFLSPKKSNNMESLKQPPIEFYDSYGMALENTPKYKGDKLLLNIGQTVKVGSKLYLTRSISLNHEARDIIKNTVKPSIPIDIEMSWDNDLKANLKGIFIGFDSNEHIILLKSQFKMEKALKRPLKTEQIESQLQKTGNTPFVLKKVSIDYSGDLFSPISKLNQFRREFLEKAEFKLLETYKPPEYKVQEAEIRYKNLKNSKKKTKKLDTKLNSHKVILGVYSDSLETIKGSLSGGAKRVYYEPKPIEIDEDSYNQCSKLPKYSLKTLDSVKIKRISSILKSAKKLCTEYDAELIWKWPQITLQHQINNYSKILESNLVNGIQEIMVDNIGAAIGIKNLNLNINISGSAGLNIWNSNSVSAVSKIFDTITPSPELSNEELKIIITNSRNCGITNRFELVVQGNVETLISKDCLLSVVPEKLNNQNISNPFWGIQDETKHIFPIKIDSEGHTHILNSDELCLIDYLPKISEIGIDTIIVDVRNKTYDYSNEITAIYSKGLEFIENGDINIKKINRLKAKIKEISTGGITTGNFLKGIKK
jgi:putative protease